MDFLWAEESAGDNPASLGLSGSEPGLNEEPLPVPLPAHGGFRAGGGSLFCREIIGQIIVFRGERAFQLAEGYEHIGHA